MKNLSFKIISGNDKNNEDILNIVDSWDKKQFYFVEPENETDYLEQNSIHEVQVLMYEDDELIGYGTLNNFIFFESSISYIINPKYRKKGYGRKLVKYLLELAKNTYLNDFAKILVLKKNLIGIKFAESLQPDFLYFDDRKIVFKKNL